MKPRGLSDEIKAQICQLFLDGASYKQIASGLKLTKGQVAGVLFRAGLCQQQLIICYKHGGKVICATCDCKNRKVLSANNAKQNAQHSG